MYRNLFLVTALMLCGCTDKESLEAPIVNPGYKNGENKGEKSEYTPWFVEDGVPNSAGEKASK